MRPKRIYLIFNLFYCLVGAMLYRCRQYGLVVLMALYYVLLVSATFYWMNNEIHQAIAWMFLFYGVIIYSGHKALKMPVLLALFLLLSFLTIFTHFIVIIPLVFLWVYFWLEKDNWPFSSNVSMLFSFLLIVIIGVKYFLATAIQSYDSVHLQGVTHFLLKDIIEGLRRPVIILFLQRSITNYWLAIIVLFLGVGALLKDNKVKLAAWVVTSCTGYFIIMGLTYAETDVNLALFHIESEWQCLGIIVATPFVFAFLPKIKPAIGIVLLAAIFIIRLVYIGNSVSEFSWRIHFQERVLAQMKIKGINKLALYREHAIEASYMLDWATGYETIFRSAMKGEVPQPTFIFIDHENNQEMLGKLSKPDCVFFWDVVPTDRMNKQYFNPDTIHPYQIMSYNDLMK